MFGFEMIVHGRENTRKLGLHTFELWCILDVNSKKNKKINQNLRHFFFRL
jgi:hypothetical protein